MLTPEYVTAIEDWLKWYNEQSKQLANSSVDRKQEYLEKAIRGIFIILAGLTHEVERVDMGKANAERYGAKLILPFRF